MKSKCISLLTWNVNGNARVRIRTDLLFRGRSRCILLMSRVENRSSSLGRIATATWSRMILNNAKYEAERRWQCEKRETKKTKRTKVGKRRGGRNTEERGGYIGCTDRRKGTSWWNNRSLAHAIASARYCARAAWQPGRLNGNGWMLASASDTRERSCSLPLSSGFAPKSQVRSAFNTMSGVHYFAIRSYL